MNDRFKFRVYVTENDAYPEKVGYVNTEDFYIHPDGEESYFNADYDFAESVIEQCTGLKDKNGKLIYEGDVVEVSEAYENGIYKVEFCQEDCEYNLYNEDGNFIYQLTKSMAKFIEVIGNIHENKDLLEVKND